jgi:hypothetical protein
MRTSTVGIAVLVTVLIASGCASSGTKKPSTYVMSPESVEPVLLPISPKELRGLDPPEAGRFLSLTRLAIARVAGSSNCPSVPQKLIIENRHRIRIDLVVGSWGRTASGRRVQILRRPSICLADLHPVPVVVAIDPARIDVHHRLKVDLEYPRFAGPRSGSSVTVDVPPFPSARIHEEVRIARASHRRLFSIFPTVPGTEPCVIPRNPSPPRDFRGTCQTSVRPRRTMEPSWSVIFTERWWPHCAPTTACSLRALRHHTWQTIEGETVVTPGTEPRVYATHSYGAAPPQS